MNLETQLPPISAKIFLHTTSVYNTSPIIITSHASYARYSFIRYKFSYVRINNSHLDLKREKELKLLKIEIGIWENIQNDGK